MQVQLYATFRLIAGEKTIQIDFPSGTPLMTVINEVVNRHPILSTHWLNDEGELHAHVHCFVNGEDIANLPLGVETPLNESDVVDFFPPVAGG